MTNEEISSVGISIEIISNITDSSILEIVEALTGTCLSEEDAGDIKRIFLDRAFG